MADRIIIDTDPGVDDALAILMALGSAELEVEALTTVFGNVDVQQTTRNALAILHVGRREDIPVYAGAATPLARPSASASGHVHGDNGLGDAPLPAVGRAAEPEPAARFLSRRLAAADRPKTLVTLGPLTNLALALALEPGIVGRLERVVCMGGAVWVPGNSTATAESNIWKDPEAADVVFGSGLPIVLVPLDVTMRTVLTRKRLEPVVARTGQLGQFLASITPAYFEFYRQRRSLDGMALHDPCTIAYMLRSDLFRTERMAMAVETSGIHCTGRLVPDPNGRLGRPATVDACLDVKSEELVDLVLERLSNAASG